jgi:hypothetical protein
LQQGEALLYARSGLRVMMMMVVPVVPLGKCRHGCAKQQYTSQYGD